MERTIGSQQTCQRCGTCCNKGGPALHDKDLVLIKNHQLAIADLITIRKGEPVFSPLVDGLEPSREELIKLSGQIDSWQCRFYDQVSNGCTIYGHRPQECQLLKCWDPSPLADVIYQHCLSRKNVLPDDDNLWELIQLQEEHCSFAQIAELSAKLTKTGVTEFLPEIGRIVNLDLKIRQKAIQRRQLSMAEELFYFGRPLFKSLNYYKLSFKEGPLGLAIIPAELLGTKR